jgi:hypothetical protein
LPAASFRPVEIGRDEQIGRGTAFDLLGERRTCCIGDFHRVAALIVIDAHRVVERFL